MDHNEQLKTAIEEGNKEKAKTIFLRTAFTDLQLSLNKLHTIASWEIDFSKIKSLWIYYADECYELPTIIKEFLNLEVLSVTVNIKSLPIELSELPKLKKLTIPTHLFAELVSIKTLDLTELTLVAFNKNDSSEFLTNIRKFKNLTALDLSKNNLSRVPEEISDLKKLEVLDLSKNKLTTLPLELSHISTLKYLKIEDNLSLTLPDEFLSMKQLSENSKNEVKHCFKRNKFKAIPLTIESGQQWSITGTFTNYKPRERALEIIESLGASVSKSITKTTTHLLAGENAGSKIEKAEDSGVRIITEDEFVDLLESLNIMGSAKTALPKQIDETGEAYFKRMLNEMQAYAERNEVQLDVSKIPQRYKDFLETGEYIEYEKMYRSFYAEPHQFKFTDDDLMELGISDEFYDTLREFAEDKYENEEKGYMIWPLSELFGPHQSSSICLFIDLTKTKCPVYIFDETDISEVASSLDKFLASLKRSNA